MSDTEHVQGALQAIGSPGAGLRRVGRVAGQLRVAADRAAECVIEALQEVRRQLLSDAQSLVAALERMAGDGLSRRAEDVRPRTDERVVGQLGALVAEHEIRDAAAVLRGDGTEDEPHSEQSEHEAAGELAIASVHACWVVRFAPLTNKKAPPPTSATERSTLSRFCISAPKMLRPPPPLPPFEPPASDPRLP